MILHNKSPSFFNNTSYYNKIMRAGGFTMQQGLTPEAASMVKQAVTLAKRRGHAQVTPLHVAHAMLSSSSSLLKTACLQSHSHPLQCKALELCFNVALNRLPASTSNPMLMGAHQNSQFPSISNALVAAFKRAQAHQRRGTIENQQPLLAVKIEIEQLIISILDDPSVSRVMKEASFSSTQVKSNVEQIVSFESCSHNHQHPNIVTCQASSRLPNGNSISSKVGHVVNRAPYHDDVDHDVRCVIDNLMNKRRKNIVIVGDSMDTLESVVRKVMESFEKGNVHEDLRDVKFNTLPIFSSFAHFSRDEAEQKLVEIKSLVKGSLEKGIVLFLGDLKWISEYRESVNCDDKYRSVGNKNWCPIEHMIMEIGKMVCKIHEEHGKFWLMGIATLQTYLKCRNGFPSLESVWDLNQITLPIDSLNLSLKSADRFTNSLNQFKGKEAGNETRNWILQLGGEEEEEEVAVRSLTCCSDCSNNFKMELRNLKNRKNTCNYESSTTSGLPLWLQQYKDESTLVSSSKDKDSTEVKRLCEKWNSICTAFHKYQSQNSSEKTLTFSSISISPSSSTSGFSYDQQAHNSNKYNTHQGGWPAFGQKRLWNVVHPFSSNPNSTPNSTSSSSEFIVELDKYVSRFNTLNDDNLNALCNALKKKVPWQQHIILEIVTSILKCRSGTVKRDVKSSRINPIKQETWLMFQGHDVEGKEKVAMELAKLFFASRTNLVSIMLSNYSSTRENSTEDNVKLSSTKRSRDEQSCSYYDRFSESASFNPHRVFLLEDIDQADYSSQLGIKRAIERGSVTNLEGDEVSLGDAIIILSCVRFSSRSRACSPRTKTKSDEDYGEMANGCLSLDLNISIQDDNIVEIDRSFDDIGLLECVDLQVSFNSLEL